MNKNICIIDYEVGNILSVKRGVEILGFNPIVTNEEKKILNADKVILPGVGAFKNGMDLLKKHNLINQLDTGVRKFNHKLSHYDICFSAMSCNLDANKNISLLDDNWYNLSEINKGVPKFQFKAVESIS